MVTSSAFGQFDPLDPRKIRGVFAENIYADPLEIDAPLTTVWEIIIDFDRYPEWNPMNRHFKLDSNALPNHKVTFGPSWGPYDLSEGAKLPDAAFTQRETITVWEENCCFSYAVISPLFNAERSQCISLLPDGKTRYHTYERMSGLLKPLIRYKYGNRIVKGFTANGIALKRRAEVFAGKQ